MSDEVDTAIAGTLRAVCAVSVQDGIDVQSLVPLDPAVKSYVLPARAVHVQARVVTVIRQ